MQRPRTSNPIPMRFLPETVEWLDALCAYHGLSRSLMAQMAIRNEYRRTFQAAPGEKPSETPRPLTAADWVSLRSHTTSVSPAFDGEYVLPPEQPQDEQDDVSADEPHDQS